MKTVLNRQLKCYSRGWHDTLGVGRVVLSVKEGEDTRSSRVLGHLARHAFVSVPAPSSLIHEEEDLVKASHIVQVKLSDIF